ncbi:MAG: putative rhamnosyl transferase, partial [Thermoanaerobaculales bacterium]|nr:putative rhamnosyl transferase [Thermoanaerobaculales bacterium]
WIGDDDQIVTRMDSDDAIHQDWLTAVEAAPVEKEVCCTRDFLRYDISTGKLCAYTRREPSPLAAFRHGRNPFAHDHSGLDRHFRVHNVAGPFLLQIFHGGNVSSRRPSWYRRSLPLGRLADFGISVQP